jgi:hypothetical protein
MNNSSKFLFAALASAACAGTQAASAPASLPEEITPMAYDGTVSDLVPAKLDGACTLNILRVSDRRFNQESIGAEFPVQATAPEPWVDSGLNRLKSYGFTVLRGEQPVPAALNLDVRLIRAYTWYGQMRINGMVAMDVDLINANAQSTEKYRALGSKSNMWNGKSEHVTALNYALNHTIHQMAQSLAAVCTQHKLVQQ